MLKAGDGPVRHATMRERNLAVLFGEVRAHQPVTRAEVEAVRGAALAQPTLDALLDAGLVASCGRKEAPGRPVLWATTPRFLEAFGLRSLLDLPGFGQAALVVPAAAEAGRPAAGLPGAAP